MGRDDGAMRLEAGGAGFTIDAADLAGLLGLTEDELRRRMRAGAIATTVERGEGADAGRFRLTFREGRRLARLIVDAEGRVLQRVRVAAPPPAPPRSGAR